MKIQQLLSKLDFRISGGAFSRPAKQVAMLVGKLQELLPGQLQTILDIGGGAPPQYKHLFAPLARQYKNLEIKKGEGVDIVGSTYKIPLKNSSVDIASMFMVLEHLERPLDALIEVNRILSKNGYLLATTVQYWHTHNHPNDYFRYTKSGLEYICKSAGFKIVDIWSIGGPFLVIFHTIELNLPGLWRTLFSIVFYRLFDWLDWKIFNHSDTRRESDSVGWSFIVKKNF